MKRGSVARGVTLFAIVIMVICIPAAATSAAVYGSTSGFIPEVHGDVNVVYSIPGYSSGLFDQSVTSFTDPETDIIFIGNDDTFSSSTASAIEQAVWDGKVLVISYPATGKFGDSLPAISGSTVKGGTTLVVTSLNNGIARAVFSDLNRTFTATQPVEEQLTGTLKPGAISLMSFTTGEPALVYRPYGKGYVVEWMFATPETYLGDGDADTVNYRIVTSLLSDIQGPATTVTTPVTTAVPTATMTTTVTASETTSTKKTGSAIVQSSPLGARVYVDGIYQGKTPLNLEDLPAGYHSVRMTLEGYYDFDGGATIIQDASITVFGSLKEVPVTTSAGATPVITTAVPTTTTPAATTTQDPLTNPTVIAAGIGIITAGIGAYATIYTNKGKKEEKK